MNAEEEKSIRHNEVAPETVMLEPIRNISTSLQPSIIVSSANYGITVSPKIIVTAPSNIVRPSSPESVLSLHKIVQTSTKLSADSPRKLKLRKENKHLRKENAALQKNF